MTWTRRRLWRIFALVAIAAMIAWPLAVAAQEETEPEAAVENPSGDLVDTETTGDDVNASNVESVDNTSGSVRDDLAKNTPFELWQMVSGVLIIPWIVEAFTKARYSNDKKRLVLGIVGLIVGLIGSYFRGELDNIPYTATGVMTLVLTGHFSYQTFMQMPIIATLMAKLGAATGGEPVASRMREIRHGAGAG